MAERGVGLSPGGYLRGLREAGGISIEQMARATKVAVRQLDALESDRAPELPAPVFVRGFVRAYCQTLGVSSDEALRRYSQVVWEAPPSPRVVSLPGRTPAFAAGPIAVSFALLVMLGLGLLAVNAFLRSEGRSDAPAPRTATATKESSPLAAPVPGAPAPRGVGAPAALDVPRSQRLLIRAIEPTWLRIQVDDGQVDEDLLAAGASRVWTADKRFRLTTGNAGGIEVELNGRAVPSLGARGVVIRQLVLPRAAAGS